MGNGTPTSEGTVEEERADEESGPVDEEHLARSRRVWDRWSEHYGRSESDFEPMRVDLIDRLDLQPGDRVLDVGCGPGVNLPPLREAVGPTGEVVAVDYSPKMVEKARERAASHGWENVEVHLADATTADLGSGYDAATATLSLSVMPDVERTVTNVRDALAPGSQLAVFDIRPAPSGPLRLANPVIWRFLRWYANWNPDGDVLETLESAFPRCRVVETYTLGTTYAAIARRAPDP